MHARRAGSESLPCIHNRCCFCKLDIDEVTEILGFLSRVGDNGGHRLADKAHDIARQGRLADRHVIELVQHRPDRLDRGNIRRGQDRGTRWRHDAHDPAGRDRAAHEAHPLGRGQVGGEAPLTGHERGIFEPADGAAHPAAVALRVQRHVVERKVQDAGARRISCAVLRTALMMF